ncbi:MAG: ester cyclase [Cyanobacteriota bacterium]|nr:ester cyclase [Cyanobacteriota bacterium]
MSSQENKAIAQQFFEESWGKGNLQAVDKLASADFKVDYSTLSAPLDREGLKTWVADLHTGFPDLQFTIQDVVAEGEKVAIRWVGKGTHKGQLNMPNLPATGKPMSYTGITIYRVVAGEVVEEIGEEDILGMLQQLGFVSAL